MILHTALPKILVKKLDIRHGARTLSMSSSVSMERIFNPTETHKHLRTMLRDFVRNEVRSCLSLSQ